MLKDRPTNMLEKLEMLFLLRANENNESYIREIGRAYEIGEEIGDEYVITLDNRNTSWMQFLNKHEWVNDILLILEYSSSWRIYQQENQKWWL